MKKYRTAGLLVLLLLTGESGVHARRRDVNRDHRDVDGGFGDRLDDAAGEQQ